MGLFVIEKATYRAEPYTYEIHLSGGFYFVRRIRVGGPVKLLYTSGEFGAVDCWVAPGDSPTFFSSFEEAERWFCENVLGNKVELPERMVEL